MAGLPWVKVATDFAEHPKAQALAVKLADARAPLYLPPIWGHFARHYADGSMPDVEYAIRALERAALWGGEPGVLAAALVEVGLLERRRARVVVHGWEEWQAGHARKLERDRERMRTNRLESRAKGRATVAEASRDGRAEEERRGRGDGEETSLRSDAAAPSAPPADASRSRAKGDAPEFKAAQRALVAAFLTETGSAYQWQGAKDSKALLALLPRGLDEITSRWRQGLAADGWLHVASVAQLASKWNDLVTARPSRRSGPGLPEFDGPDTTDADAAAWIGNLDMFVQDEGRRTWARARALVLERKPKDIEPALRAALTEVQRFCNRSTARMDGERDDALIEQAAQNAAKLATDKPTVVRFEGGARALG